MEEYDIEELLHYLFLKKLNLFKLLCGVLRLLGAIPFHSFPIIGKSARKVNHQANGRRDVFVIRRDALLPLSLKDAEECFSLGFWVSLRVEEAPRQESPGRLLSIYALKYWGSLNDLAKRPTLL